MIKEKRAASDILLGVVDNNSADEISFYDLKTALHERGFGILMVIFSLPVSLPIPPGVASIPSIPLLIFSMQMVMGMDSPWLPKWLGEKCIKRTTVAYMVEKTAPYLRKVEKLLKPRLSFMSSTMGERLIGIFSLIFAIAILIPFPMTNLIPALGILIMSLGLLSKDGLVIIGGMIVGSIGISLAITVYFMGKIALDSFLKNIFF